MSSGGEVDISGLVLYMGKTVLPRRLLDGILDTVYEGGLFLDHCPPHLEDHPLLAPPDASKVLLGHPLHGVLHLPLSFLAHSIHIYQVSFETCLHGNCPLPVRFDYQINVGAFNGVALDFFKLLPLSVFSHEFDKDPLDVLQVFFVVVLDRSLDDGFLFVLTTDFFLPDLKMVVCLFHVDSDEVVANLFVRFLGEALFLAVDVHFLDM